YYRCFFFSSRRRHTRCLSDWSSDVCSSDLIAGKSRGGGQRRQRALETGGRKRNYPGPRAFGHASALCPLRRIARAAEEFAAAARSEERRVGKECRCRWAVCQSKRKSKRHIE